jgi:hypothetical protein
MNIEKDYAANSGRISGGVGWSIQFNTPDCQHGWSVIKEGTGQSSGCYFKEEDAKKALEALAVTEPIVNKCMTCGCDDLGNDHHYISDEEKCLYCVTKGQGPCWDGYQYAGTKPGDNGKPVPNCIPSKKVEKADSGFKPNAGMKAAAKRALAWKEAGKANGAGTSVGWGRARQIVNGDSLSADVVKRMFSFFSRHEVDKQGKDWDKPSHGKVMWNAWGGDAGYAWSRAIVARLDKIEKGIASWDGAFSPIIKNEKSGRTDQDKQEGIGTLSFWDGSLAPVMGNEKENNSWMSSYNTPPQNDGKPSVGYGNHSDSNGRSNQ